MQLVALSPVISPGIYPSAIQLVLSTGSSFCNPHAAGIMYMQLMSHSLSLDTPINCILNGHRCAKQGKKDESEEKLRDAMLAIAMSILCDNVHLLFFV